MRGGGRYHGLSPSVALSPVRLQRAKQRTCLEVIYASMPFLPFHTKFSARAAATPPALYWATIGPAYYKPQPY